MTRPSGSIYVYEQTFLTNNEGQGQLIMNGVQEHCLVVLRSVMSRIHSIAIRELSPVNICIYGVQSLSF